MNFTTIRVTRESAENLKGVLGPRVPMDEVVDHLVTFWLSNSDRWKAQPNCETCLVPFVKDRPEQQECARCLLLKEKMPRRYQALRNSNPVFAKKPSRLVEEKASSDPKVEEVDNENRGVDACDGGDKSKSSEPASTS